MTRRRVVVVGAGLAGLAAAVSALEHGADVTVLERRDSPGGATIDSAGWIWRYRDLATARTCAPHADPAVSAAIVARLDDDLAWLQRAGGKVVSEGTGRTITAGIRVDPRQVVHALVDRIGDRLRLRSAVAASRHAADGRLELRIEEGRLGALVGAAPTWEAADAVVFAGGGYAADLGRVAAECGAPHDAADEWVLRAPGAGTGASMDAATMLGGLRIPASGESLVRLVPRVDELPDPRALARFGELQLAGTVLRTRDGAEVERSPHDWSGALASWEFARRAGAGRLEFERATLREHVHGGLVEDIVRAAIATGADAGRLDGGGAWLAVRAGFTHTLCGLRVDADGRVLHARSGRFRRRDHELGALRHVYAAGADAAGSGLGGTASGLAQALVLGRRAGELAAAGD